MQKPRILIVDDSLDIVEIFRKHLDRSLECELYDAVDGKDALDKIRLHRFDLIILDLKMPGLSGLDVIREAKREGELASILVVTAYDSIQMAEEVISAGAADYITKPVSLDTMKLKIKSLLEKRNKYFEKKNNHNASAHNAPA